MKDTQLFEKFYASPNGRRVWKAFLKTKKGTEDPVGLILKKAEPEKRVNYLDIGGGTGEKTIRIAKTFGFRSVDFIEPSIMASGIFGKGASKESFSHRIFNMSFEKFVANRKYDLITAIHSWYYVGLHELDRLYGMLNDDGVACIYLDRKSDIIKRMQDICEKRLGFASNNIEDLEDFLNGRKISFEIFCEKKQLNGLLKNGQLTEKTRTIMSLVAYTPWNSISKDTKDEIRNMLIGCRNDFPMRRCLIVIRRPSRAA